MTPEARQTSRRHAIVWWNIRWHFWKRTEVHLTDIGDVRPPYLLTRCSADVPPPQASRPARTRNSRKSRKIVIFYSRLRALSLLLRLTTIIPAHFIDLVLTHASPASIILRLHYSEPSLRPATSPGLENHENHEKS